MLLTLVSISAIYADTGSVANSTFTIPEGYTIFENNTLTILYNDNISITMYQGPIIDPEQAKEKRIDMGYSLTGDYDYDFDGIEINQQNYNLDGINTCIYTFEKNNKTYIITLNMDDNQQLPDNEDNPVSLIIATLK